jgi:hypothetical protein
LVIETVAPGKMPPLESVTVPRIVAVVDVWAHPEVAIAKTRPRANPAIRRAGPLHVRRARNMELLEKWAKTTNSYTDP